MNENPEVQTEVPADVVNVAADGMSASVDPAAAAAAADEAKAKAEEEGLLAGKFKTQDDLVKAYKELESKLGQKQPQQPAEEEPKEEDTTEGDDKTEAEEGKEGDETDYGPYGKAVSEALAAAGLEADTLSKEMEENGSFSDETFQKFEEAGYPRAVVEAYLRGVSAMGEEISAVTESQIAQIKAVAGGDEGFAELQQWMASNYTQDELASYNEAISSGDFTKAFQAVADANNRYRSDIGHEGELLGGKASASSQGYASEAEMLADMRKPEYKTDPAFRDTVAKKIAASPGLFVVR